MRNKSKKLARGFLVVFVLVLVLPPLGFAVGPRHAAEAVFDAVLKGLVGWVLARLFQKVCD